MVKSRHPVLEYGGLLMFIFWMLLALDNWDELRAGVIEYQISVAVRTICDVIIACTGLLIFAGARIANNWHQPIPDPRPLTPGPTSL